MKRREQLGRRVGSLQRPPVPDALEHLVASTEQLGDLDGVRPVPEGLVARREHMPGAVVGPHTSIQCDAQFGTAERYSSRMHDPIVSSIHPDIWRAPSAGTP